MCLRRDQIYFLATTQSINLCKYVGKRRFLRFVCVDEAEFGCTAVRFDRYEGVTPNICVSPRTLKMTILMLVMFLYRIA